MCALRLECFAKDAEASSKTMTLFEGFESEKDIAFSKGVKSGAEAVTKAFETEKIRSLAPILEAMNDIGFSQIEARHAAIKSLQPLLSAIIETTLPACSAAGFTQEVVARVMDIVNQLPDAKISIFVPENAVQSISEMLAPAHANHVVIGDPALGPLQARVEWPSGFESLNIAGTLDSISQSIDEFFVSREQIGQNHG